MKQILILTLLLSWSGFRGLAATSEANASPKNVLPDDPDLAWSEVSKGHQTLRPPADWRQRAPTTNEVAEFQNKVRAAAWTFANHAQEFIRRFPTNENIGDARITVVYALGHAVAAGDAEAEKAIQKFKDSVLADSNIPEDDRAAVLLYAGNVVCMKKVGMRFFTEGVMKLRDEFDATSLDVMRAALKRFPTNSLLYTMMVATAQNSPPARQQELAREIRDAPGAPAGAKALAEHLLNGTKPYEVGKPLDIRFTALDGREVDLANLKGRVVLVEFWSTSCGPYLGEMPRVKAAYEKLHDRGFEVVAISLDDKESALCRFIADKQLPWPQHFDGKGWGNKFAVQYGIFSIPTMWLVDKRGNLRETNARGALDRQVESLLSEN